MHNLLRSQRRWFVCLTAVLLLAAPGSSQEGTGDTAPDVPPERTIYVPYRDLKGVFEQLGAGVFVPYSEWLKMRQQLEQGGPEGAAVTAVITESAYSAVVEQDLARITARLKVNVLGKPWVELPVRFGEAAVGKLTGPEGKVLLRGTGDGAYTLLLGEAGEHEITLELVARVQTSPDGREFSLDVPPVGITSFEVSVPEADQSIEVTPKVAIEPGEAAEGQTRIRASVGATGRLTARWRPRVSQTPDMELLASVTNIAQVSIEDGLVRTDAWLTFDVLRGTVSQLRLEAPVEQRILDVTSPARLKAWRTEEADGRQIITIDLLNPADKQVVIEVHAEHKLPEGEFSLAGRSEDGATHGIHALDAVREAGQIVVRNAPDLDLALSQQQGLVRIETAQVDERIRAEGGVAFKFYSPRFTLAATAKPVEPRVLLNHTTQITLREDEVRLDAFLTYAVERAGVFQLLLTVPEGLVIDDVQCPAMKEFSLDAATRLLTIHLAERTLGQINVSVAGHLPFDSSAGQASLSLPVLEPQQVTREDGTIRMFARDSIEVVTNDEQITAAQPLPAPPGERSGDALLTAAWSFTRRPISIPVTIKRKAPRLGVDVATSINVLPQSAEIRTYVDYQVQFAGIDTFQFQVPEAVSGSLQIEAVQTDPASPAIKQKTPGDPQDGWVTWTIVMQREVVGTLRLSLTYDIQSPAAAEAPAAEDAADAAAAAPADQIAVQLVRPLPAPESNGRAAVPLSRIRGEVSVQHEASLAVGATASGGDIETIDVRELTLLPGEGTVAYRYFDQPGDAALSLALTRTRHKIHEVVSTIVRRELVEIANEKDGTAVYRVRMQVKTTERQRLLVDLPTQLDLIGVTVSGRTVKLEEAAPADDKVRLQAHYVPVSRTTSADEEFSISFDFTWKVTPHLGGSDFLRGTLELPLPVLGGFDAPAAVQELRVAVWVPRDYALVGEPEGFVIERQPRLFSALTNTASVVNSEDLNAWIGDSGSTMEIAKPGLTGYSYAKIGGSHRIRVVWWNRLYMTIIVSIAVAVVAWILGRTSWENKLWWLLAATFVLALVALWDVDRVAHSVSAARFGLAFLLGWWLVAGLFVTARAAAPVLPATVAIPTPPPPSPPAPMEVTTFTEPAPAESPPEIPQDPPPPDEKRES
ncbi:MAG: hypothetical protein JNG89_20915 [Planctomycetaceae bacterium]|nr:hypothetical protein [Planctomycetaceae bacterium]